MNEFIPDYKKVLTQEFYIRPPAIVAKELLGKVLVRFLDERNYTAGKIVETEAYLSENDLSSHSAVGKTKRNDAMFCMGGIMYVYKIYGIHHCINFVTEEEGIGSAVLIRALEPIAGIDIMKKNRRCDDIKNLCSGPAKLAQAFGFNLSDNHKSLQTCHLFVQNFVTAKTEDIAIGKRIGITKSSELPLRFFLAHNSYISRKK